MKKLPLTKTEEKVLAYILGYITDNEYPPTLKEIGLYMEYPIKSCRQSARVIVKNLEAKGRIIINNKTWRNIEIK